MRTWAASSRACADGDVSDRAEDVGLVRSDSEDRARDPGAWLGDLRYSGRSIQGAAR